MTPEAPSHLSSGTATIEVYPGFHDELHADIEATGGWVCEEHGLPWPHDDCPGPGMPARDVEDSDGCFVRRQHPHPPDRLASAVRYTP